MSENQPTKEKQKICFVIAPIGEPESETRKESDQVLNYIIKPVMDETGYETIRADSISKPGVITSQIIQQIVEAQLIVADLSDNNPNVFYELAIRHALRKPYIHLITKGETIPFDVAPIRTIEYDIHDVESVDSAKKELSKQVASIQDPKIEVESPISMALVLKTLQESTNPLEKSTVEIISMLQDLRASVKKIANRTQYFYPGSMSPASLTLQRWALLHAKELKDQQAPILLGPFDFVPSDKPEKGDENLGDTGS
jgi:hypothetical protein